jgi:hypothetical protein
MTYMDVDKSEVILPPAKVRTILHKAECGELSEKETSQALRHSLQPAIVES